MTKIVVGVALLPPEEVMTQAIELNKRELVAKGYDKTILHKENCVPHMSLYIGCVEEDNLPRIKQALEELAEEYQPLSLKIDGIDFAHLPNGEKASGLRVIKTQDLQTLHERVMGLMMPLRVETYGKDAVYSPPAVDDITLTLIDEYPLVNYQKFNPPITLGIGEVETREIQTSFTASKLALFHYGNYCTCRKKLFSVELKKG